MNGTLTSKGYMYLIYHNGQQYKRVTKARVYKSSIEKYKYFVHIEQIELNPIYYSIGQK